MPRSNILALLGGGDRKSIGHSDRVAEIVARDPGLFPGLMAGLWSKDLLVRIRAADAVEKVTRASPALLRPHKKELLGLMGEAKEPALRWHLAIVVPRLLLKARERQLIFNSLRLFLEDRSSIVRTFALQGLADLAQGDPSILPGVIDILRQATRNGSPAMKARSRKLLWQLDGD